MSIRFEFECWQPFDYVEVIAHDDGSGVLIIDLATDEEIEFKDLADSDQSRIRALINDWILHHQTMEGLHPANEAFGAQYVNDLNKDMNK